MRRRAVALAGIATLGVVLGTLVGGSASAAPRPQREAGPPPVNAPRPQAAPLPQPAGYAPRAAAPPKCDEPEKSRMATPVPYPQKMFGDSRVWTLSTGTNVKIAVLDTGVDASHPQLKGADIARGADFVNGNGSGTGRRDCDGHGTAVASLIAAQATSGVGFQGLAYRATILPVVVSAEHDEEKNFAATTSPEKFARAIAWAVSHGAKVINISLIMTEDHEVVRQAIADAVANDVVVVAAAGNGAVERRLVNDEYQLPNPGPDPYPALYEDVIGVGAVGPADDGHFPVLKTSQWGDYVDLAAPGGKVLVADRGGGHTVVSGNTYAAAFVSATAALVRAKWPELSAREVARRLYATASRAAGPRVMVGHGLVDPYRALTEGLSDESPQPRENAEPYSPDPEAVARAEERAYSSRIAFTAAGIGVALAGGMLATLTLLPRGNRRRWRPGRARSFPEPEPEDGLPPAPVQLFEDLEPN